MAIFSMRKVKNANAAGSFYDLVPEKLSKTLTAAANSVEESSTENNSILHGAVIPHAGYVFSLECALKTLLPVIKNKKYQKIVILSPSHRKYFRGIAYSDYTSFAIPLGELQVDTFAIEKLKNSTNNLFTLQNDVFNFEHAIEVILPIIRHFLGKIDIVPLIVGALNIQELNSCAKTLENLDDENTLWIISSDFTHYGKNFNYIPFGVPANPDLFYKQLNCAATFVADQNLSGFLKHLSETNDTICGSFPIALYLTLLKLKNKEIKGEIASITSSSEKTNNWSCAVGYCGIRFTTEN